MPIKHLLSLLAVGVLAAASQIKSAAAGTGEVQQPFFVPPGGSHDTDLSGAARHITVKVSGADTGGAFAVLEVPTVVDAGSPLHIHHVENEWFYALEGEYDIRVGAQIFHLKPGGSVYGPKLVPHAWHDVGDTPGRMIVVAQPAGHIEAWLKDLDKMTPAEAQDPGAMKALFEKHNMEIVGPPLPKKLAK
jgi:mannose-6-phosphate isomerase-like protein (cupin superfamily)